MAAINDLPFSSAHASQGRPAANAVDARMVALMRCVLVFSGLAIIYVDPTEPARYVQLTYLSVSGYCVWSVFLFIAASRGSAVASPWVDVAWATYLVALTQGTSSIFFFLFLFGILVESFSGGYRRGFAMAAVSSALFIVVGWFFSPSGGEFELNRSLIRPVYLLAIGWMMAMWGGRETVLRRRIALLRDIGGEWNPRSGMQRTIHANLERIQRFFAASECLLVVRETGQDKCTLYKVAPSSMGTVKSVTEMERDIAGVLLDFEPQRALSYDGRAETARGEAPPADMKCRDLAGLLDTDMFVAVPYAQANGVAGRLFVMRNDEPFTDADLSFLEQLALAVSHVVENTQLIDELVLKAAEHERFRISLDIHDTTVQPYIGLKLGLDALSREAEGNPLAPRIGDLLEMANTTIRDLRGFATGIRERAPISGESLLNALREQAERFQRFYGVEVHLESEQSLFISPQIASEAFRMISEGLSNVMRHTTCRRAFVRISRTQRELQLLIANDGWGPTGRHPSFTPRSINARALSLGGASFVEQGVDGRSAVHISIPV